MTHVTRDMTHVTRDMMVFRSRSRRTDAAVFMSAAAADACEYESGPSLAAHAEDWTFFI